MALGDFGPSLSAFPTPVMTIILRAMPWTFGLLVVSTIFAWIVGNTLGALAGYFRDNKFLKVIGMGVMAMQPLPTYIVGLALVIFLGYLWPILPISGGAQVNLQPALDWTYIRSLLVHGTLPAVATSEILPRLARIPKLEEDARLANPKARANKGQTEEERAARTLRHASISLPGRRYLRRQKGRTIRHVRNAIRHFHAHQFSQSV